MISGRTSSFSGPSSSVSLPYSLSFVSHSISACPNQHFSYGLHLINSDIPGLNRVVFKHTEITWEIAASFIALAAFIILVEFWKYGKRFYYRQRAARHPEENEEMPGVFAAWKTIQAGDTSV